MKIVLIASLMAFFASASAWGTDGIYVCAEHTNPDDWEDEFIRGPVVVPAGTVFEYAGHLMSGDIQDRKDWAHSDGIGWKGISKEEDARRTNLLAQDFAVDQKNTSAVATTAPITLTRLLPCALAPAEAVLSKQWGWTLAPIAGDATVYYQVYGIIRRGVLDTDFASDDVPVNHLVARGQLNGSVSGTITKILKLDEWSASQPPDELPVSGKGNSECWGDDRRIDISCRALTEDFLLRMRGATKSQVVAAMNVNGREINQGRRFISNYSKGARWGSGTVNFSFDGDGRVSVIAASIDPPNMAGASAAFIWNIYAAPPLGEEIDRSTKDYSRQPYCSDISGSPAKCAGGNIDRVLTLTQMSFNSTKSELLRMLEASCNLGTGIIVSDPAEDCARLRKRLR